MKRNKNKLILTLLIVAIALLTASLLMSAIGMKQRADIKELLQHDRRIHK